MGNRDEEKAKMEHYAIPVHCTAAYPVYNFLPDSRSGGYFCGIFKMEYLY